jgi:hypothetical protein
VILALGDGIAMRMLAEPRARRVSIPDRTALAVSTGRCTIVIRAAWLLL